MAPASLDLFSPKPKKQARSALVPSGTSTAVGRGLTAPVVAFKVPMRRPVFAAPKRRMPKEEQQEEDRFLKRRRVLSPLACFGSADNQLTPDAPRARAFNGKTLGSGTHQQLQSPSIVARRTSLRLKRTRVSVNQEELHQHHQEPFIHHEPMMNDPQEDGHGVGFSTPPQHHPSTLLGLGGLEATVGSKKEEIVTEKDVLSPMSRRLLAAVGMTRFNQTTALDILKGNMENVSKLTSIYQPNH
jgi:hypothetical protein